jgi:tetratricopeptide (TPR) repeat protein
LSDSPNAKDRALGALTPPSTYLTPRPDGSASWTVTESEFVSGSIFAGRYRIVALLGRDPWGEVWRADDLVLQTPVALKLLPPTTTDAHTRILTEVRQARQITHPAVCRVFDVGEAGGRAFYSRELVEGEDLATLLRRAERLAVEKVIDIGGQLCDALAAAHAQGVLHLNLKPAYVLIDAEGFIRIIDFGVSIDDVSDPASRDYRAPEQHVPAGQVSERTDLYSVGVILYELLAGHPLPPEARNKSGRWQKPSRFVPEVTPQLDRLILEALSQDPQQRPVNAATMAEQLRHPATTLSRPWGWVAAALVVIIAAVAALASFYYPTTASPALSDRDTIVVADFVNTTGEPVFDGALKVALAVALEQSPFMKVFPDERVRDTLRLMERPPDSPVTREVAREIAAREQLSALIAGSIARLGTHYVLAIEAVNTQSGDVIAREQVEVPDREQVLSALGGATSRLRARLGESLSSVQRFDVPLARATTASLDALHAYSLALDDGRMNLRVEAIPHLERALELDPQFALAQAMLSGIYANTGRTAEAPAFSRRAFELRDRVSERERFFISWRYYIDSAQAWDQALALASSWARTYPREPFAFNSLGMTTAAFGRHEPAVDAFRTAIGLDRRFVPPHGNLVGSLTALGRFEDARTAIREARNAGIDALSLHRATYLLAFLGGDRAGMAEELATSRANTETALPSLNWEAHAAAFEGRLRAAHDLFVRGVEQAASENLLELAAQWQAEHAEVHALTGGCREGRAEAAAALARSRDNFTLERAARTFAFCDDDRATALASELTRRFPDATLTRQIQVPIIDALITYRQQPAAAIDRLESLRPYDGAPSAEFWPAYIRGMAYLGLKDGAKAGAEFQRILDNRGVAPTSLLYPLARLGSARAAVLAGDTARARRAYDDLLRLWPDADAQIPLVQQVRRESLALR